MDSFRFSLQKKPEWRTNKSDIKRPRELACFSFDSQHICHPGSDASLRWYHPPVFNTPGVPVPRIDLTAGIKSFERYDDNAVDLHLDALLETLKTHEQQTGAKVEADIVTWRGMMTRILTAPYDETGEFEMNATCFQGTIFIEENHAARDPPRSSSNYRRGLSHEQLQYCGYKFETLATLPRPLPECTREEIESRDQEVVNTYEQYCSIVKTGIGDCSMVLAGEVDAIIGERPSVLLSDYDNCLEKPPAPHYIELKTTKAFTPSSNPNDPSSRETINFEKKLCRIWAQSFLLNIPTIMVGHRTEDGLLERIDEWKTLKIPSNVKPQHGGYDSWNATVCVNFAAEFLEFLKRTITGHGNWRIEKKKTKQRTGKWLANEIRIFRLPEDEVYKIVSEDFKVHRQCQL